MRRKYKKQIEELEESITFLHKKVRQLECSHSETHFTERQSVGLWGHYGCKEIRDKCDKVLRIIYDEEEMLKIKIERDEKRLAEIKKTKVKIK